MKSSDTRKHRRHELTTGGSNMEVVTAHSLPELLDKLCKILKRFGHLWLLSMKALQVDFDSSRDLWIAAVDREED